MTLKQRIQYIIDIIRRRDNIASERMEAGTPVYKVGRRLYPARQAIHHSKIHGTFDMNNNRHSIDT